MTQFEALLYKAKSGDEKSIAKIIEMYHPLLYGAATHEKGYFSEDLYQELLVIVWQCINKF